MKPASQKGFSTSVGTVTIDEEGHVLSIDAIAQGFFGYSEDEAVGRKVNNLMPDPYRSEHDGYISHYLKTGEAKVIGRGREVVGRHKSGKTFPMWLAVSEVKIKDKRVFVGSVVDLSDQKEAMQELAQSLEITRGILETAINPIITISNDGKIRSYNPAAQRLFGYTMEETLGNNVNMLMPEPYHSEHDGYISTFLQTNRPKIIGKGREVLGRRKDGTTFPMHLSVGKMETGEKKMFVGIITDISERKKIEAELILSKEEADQASKAKSEFLANMSHEIRTPLNTILGTAELLAETDLTPDQRNYVDSSRIAGENLLEIINAILDLSKIESGKFDIKSAGFNLNKVVDDVCRVMSFRVHSKGLELISNIQPEVPTGIVGDDLRLGQMLINLIGNAVKFTEKGHIYLEVEKEGEGEGFVLLRFTVEDTGIGIKRDRLEAIFESFTQADSSTTRKYGGTGLGLTITKKFAEMMGGRLSVRSEHHKGSAFFFTIKVGLEPRYDEKPIMVARDIKGMRALVVNDHPLRRKILRKMVEGWGFIVTAVEGGGEALRKMRQAGDDPFDLVLLDYHMPDMDGFAVAEAIQKESLPGAVILVSASNVAIDEEKIERLGIKGYCLSVVRKVELFEMIMVALGKKDAQEKPAKKKGWSYEKMPPLSILLAEDNGDNSTLFFNFTKKTPFQTILAENGRIAVEQFKSRDFDLVLMDMEMPEMGGLEATEVIRQWEEANGKKRTPIVALTAHALQEHQSKVAEAGCDGFLAKPFKKKELIENILKFGKGET